MTKRIQEYISNEAKTKLEKYAENHKLNQSDALDEIILKSMVE